VFWFPAINSDDYSAPLLQLFTASLKIPKLSRKFSRTPTQFYSTIDSGAKFIPNWINMIKLIIKFGDLLSFQTCKIATTTYSA
jgi:hypothetical protein